MTNTCKLNEAMNEVLDATIRDVYLELDNFTVHIVV